MAPGENGGKIMLSASPMLRSTGKHFPAISHNPAMSTSYSSMRCNKRLSSVHAAMTGLSVVLVAAAGLMKPVRYVADAAASAADVIAVVESPPVDARGL